MSKAAKKQLKLIVTEVIPATKAMPIDERQYQDIMSAVKQKITADSKASKSRRHFDEQLHSLSKILINLNGLRLPPEPRPQQIGRSETHKGSNWPADIRAMRALDGRFADAVASLMGGQPDLTIATSGAHRLGLVLWSAATRGLLLEAELLQALCVQLQRDACPFERRGDDLFVRLHVVRRPGEEHLPANSWADDERARVHHWQPDAVTLMLIRKYLEHRDMLAAADDAFSCLRNALPINVTFNSILKLASRFSDHDLKLHLPEALLTAARGAYPCVSLDDDARHPPESRQPVVLDGEASRAPTDAACAHNDNLAFSPAQPSAQSTPAAVRVAEVSSPAASAAMTIPANNASSTNLARATGRDRTKFGSDSMVDLADDLAALFKDALSSRKKVVVRTLRKRAAEQDVDTVANLLMLYLAEFLDKYKLTSAETYFRRIGKRLLISGGCADMNDFDEAGLRDLYQSVFDAVGTAKQRGPVAETLSQFHGFCRGRINNLPKVSFRGEEFVVHRNVRARHLSAASINQVLTACSVGQDDGHAVAAMFATVVAYRAGLRLTEVYKLRPIDVEASDELWLFVRANQYGTLKSPSAKRRIPLGALLHPAERAIVRRTLALCLQKDEPIVVQVGRFASKRTFSDAVQTPLKTTLGASWTFHHLRHAAANNLFLALCDEPELCSAWSGWDAAEQSKVIQAVTVHPRRHQERFVALALVMGHADPEQTFTSYTHLWPDVLASRIDRLPVTMDAKLLSCLTGLRPDRLRKLGDWQSVRRCQTRGMAAYVHSRPWPSSGRTLGAPDFLKNCSGQRSQAIRTIGALTLLQDGHSFEGAARIHDLDIAEFVSFAGRSRRLSSFTTNRGNPRLGRAEESLVPLLPRGSQDLDHALDLFEELHGGGVKYKRQIGWLLDHFIQSARVDGHNIRITGVDGAIDIAHCLHLCGISRERLFVKITSQPPFEASSCQKLGIHYSHVSVSSSCPVHWEIPGCSMLFEVSLASRDQARIPFSAMRLAFELLFISGLLEEELFGFECERQVRQDTARQDVALHKGRRYVRTFPRKPARLPSEID